MSGFFVVAAVAQNLTVQVGAPPLPPTPLVEHTNIWHWHKGTNAPVVGWQTVSDAGLDATWGSGPGGFGYNTDNTTPNETNECRTVLFDMSGTTVTNYSTFYIRRTFTVDSGVDTNLHIQLAMDWDDGFIAWLDGVFITNRNTTATEPAYTATASPNHESSRGSSGGPIETYDLGAVGTRTGAHVLAIMGLNGNKSTSSDFVLIGDLSLAGGTFSNPSGAFGTLVTSNTVALTGLNSVPGSARVTVNGDDANYFPASNSWSRVQSLKPGLNRLYVAAADAGGNILSNITTDIIYQTSTVNLGGTLASSVVLSNGGTVAYVTNNLTVPANVTFEVANGAVVLVNPGQRIITQAGGRIYVHGLLDEPVFFNVNGATNVFWGPLSGTGTNASIELHFADISHAQVNATTNAYGLIQDTAIHDFDPGAAAPGTWPRPIMHCDFASSFVARRVHVYNYWECLVRNGIIQVEHCLFEHLEGDALDFDSAQPGSYTRNCTYRHGNRGNADAVDIGPGDLPGSTDTRIENCIMWDFPFDKGVSVGDVGSSHGIIVSNCLIYACNAGVMSKSLCDVSVRNCTIVENDSGLTNYNKVNPSSPTGGGITTNSYNNIVWNNITAIGLANGSQLFADHNIFGNTNWPGAGNIDVNPLFVNPATRDYRLQAASPALTSGRNGTYMGVTYPLGGIPARPLRLAVQSNSTNELGLNWVDDSQNEDGVVVQRSTDGMNWIQIATLGAEATNYTDATALLQQKYYYRVQHTNYIGVSPYSNIGGGTRQGATIFVGGTISVNTIWPAGSTIIVTSSVTVAASATLTIESCAHVLFNQGFSLTVNGLLIAEGTPDCRIVFTRNAGATSWGGINLAGASSTHRITYADLDRISGNNIDVSSTAVYLQNLWWTNTTSELLNCTSSSLTLLDSYIPGGFGNEPVHFNNMPANGYALIKGNVFGAPAGYNDSIDFTGGNRPGPIVQFIDNVFLAAVDDCMDLDSTDAHIEGNIFLNVHQDAIRPSTANAVSTGEGSGTSELVVVRNIFYNCDHALLLKDMGSAVFENNTVVTIETNQFSASRAAYVQFGEPHRGVPGGRGILMNGNILWDLHSTTPFIVFTNGTMFMV
ncbi:MAG TPA: right-handed parallel beta-helix repeat-containing protein, partial [Verrucomicrobiae bacterium]